MMTPGKILKRKVIYPDLQDIKISDPEKYREITKQIILDNLSETLPHYNKWQKRNHEYPVYEASLPNLEDILSNIDYSVYDMGLEGKRELTEYFYQVCSPYRFQDIVDLADSYDLDTSLKIKNLVNRSFRKFYSNRQRVISHIKKYVPNTLENKGLSILNYVPFQNPRIGIEWLSQCKFTSLSEICEGWILLLCIDLDLFSPESYFDDLIDFLGRENADLLIEKLAIFLAGCPYKTHPFISIEKQLLNRVAKYRKLLNKFHIITLPLRDLKVKTNKLQYEVFIYQLPYRLTRAQQILLKTKMNSLEEISVVIPNESNSSAASLEFLFKNDEDRILSILNDICNLHTNSADKKETNEQINSNKKGSPEEQKNPTKIVTIDRTIARGVRASELIFKGNKITFTNTDGVTHSLRSVRIHHNFNSNILEKVNHRFNLVKDWSGKREGNKTKHRFIFEPANDFSFLLAEIERLSINHTYISDNNFPQCGEFDVPWKYARFYDGILMIIHPNPSKRGTFTPFHFRNSDILKSFEDIRFYIENKSPKLRVQAADGVINGLLNFKEFISVISQVEIIRRFLASEIKNKRQKLSYVHIRFNNPCIRLVKRIKHTNLIDWKYNLQSYL